MKNFWKEMGKNFLSYAKETIVFAMFLAVIASSIFVLVTWPDIAVNGLWFGLNVAIAAVFLLKSLAASLKQGRIFKFDKAVVAALAVQILFNVVSIGVGWLILKGLNTGCVLGACFFVGVLAIALLLVVGLILCTIISYIRSGGFKNLLCYVALLMAKAIGFLAPIAVVGLICWLIMK